MLIVELTSFIPFFNCTFGKNLRMKTPKLMVIDDCDLMRKFIELQCKKIGEVYCFEDGLTAIKSISIDFKPDLIILDLNLPNFSGFQFLERLCNSDLLKSIPVLVLSGNTDVQSRITCLEIGASDFLAKPFHPVELSLRIKTLLKSSKMMVI